MLSHIINASSLLTALLDAWTNLGAHHLSFISTCTDGTHRHNDCIMQIVSRKWTLTIRPR